MVSKLWWGRMRKTKFYKDLFHKNRDFKKRKISQDIDWQNLHKRIGYVSYPTNNHCNKCVLWNSIIVFLVWSSVCIRLSVLKNVTCTIGILFDKRKWLGKIQFWMMDLVPKLLKDLVIWHLFIPLGNWTRWANLDLAHMHIFYYYIFCLNVFNI